MKSKNVGHPTGPVVHGLVTLDGLEVEVNVLQTRENFGRVDALVTPVAGRGERWIDRDRIQPYRPTRGREEEQGDETHAGAMEDM